MMKKLFCVLILLLIIVTGCSSNTHADVTTAPGNTAASSARTMIPRATLSPTPAPALRMVAESMTDMKQLVINNEIIINEQKTGVAGMMSAGNIRIISEYAIGNEYFMITEMCEPTEANLYTLAPKTTFNNALGEPAKLRLYIFNKVSDIEWQLTYRLSVPYNSGSQSKFYQIAYADLADRTIIFGGVGNVYLYSTDPSSRDVNTLVEEWDIRVTKLSVQIAEDKPIILDTSDNWGYVMIADLGARIKEMSVFAGTREFPRVAIKNYVIPWPYGSEEADIVAY